MKAATLDANVGIFFPSPWKSTMFWVLLTSLLPLAAALQWTDSPTNHTQISSCSNSDIYLPGNFTLSPEEEVVDITWKYRAENGSTEVLAINITGNFNPMASSQTVRWTGQAGLAISPAAGPTLRNYTVEVRTWTSNTFFANYYLSITVEMTDPPISKNGKLNMRQESKAVYDNTTGEWRVQLSCGVFRDLGHPAASVIWTTPEGRTMESSSQDHGTFRLLIPNPPSGGNYTCTLSPLSPAVRCLPPLSPLLKSASFNVDEIKARFTILETQKKDTEARLRETETWQSETRTQLEARIEQQEQHLMQVKSELEREKKVKDCVDAKLDNKRSGVVTIYPDNNTRLQVYCDQDTDGGGWLVFQRRQDGRVDFYRNWASYQNGFGDVSKNFWLGLDALHMLTSGQSCELRVDVMMFNGTTGYATFSNFAIGDSSNNYRLSVGAFTGGNAGDSLLERHKDQQFSTYDADHDTSKDNCANMWHGAWWYKDCHHSNLNGLYKTSRSYYGDGVNWHSFDTYHSLRFAAMKLRPQK